MHCYFDIVQNTNEATLNISVNIAATKRKYIVIKKI